MGVGILIGGATAIGRDHVFWPSKTKKIGGRLGTLT